MEICKKVWYNIIGIVIIEYYNLYARFVFASISKKTLFIVVMERERNRHSKSKQ